jgi:outer membrane lipoprotein-sorting protein
MGIRGKILLLVFTVALTVGSSFAQDAKEIVDRANELLRGKSNYSEMTMEIIRPKWNRTLKFKSWAKGNDYSLIYILAPAKEKGQVFLKRKKEMWNWIPSIERRIKIPPSMMMQSWMGSDVTNDDLVKESSIVDDYSHKILGAEDVTGYDCWKIELIPDEDAPVVWGKIITWISKENHFTLKNEYYDEDGYLQNIETLSKIKDVGGRTIPTLFEIIPVDKEGHKTTMEFNKIEFEKPIKDEFFSIQNMKRIR